MRMSFWRSHADVDAKNKRGFTLVELIIVVAVLAILAVVAVPKAADLMESAKNGTDKENLRMLNSATMMYSVNKGNKNVDIFEGISSENERIQRLVDANYLNKSVAAQQKNASFQWDVTGQVWKLVSDGNGGTNTPSPSSAPSPTPPSQYPAWDSSKAYDQRTYITYDGRVFYNIWYASPSDIPGTVEVWQEVTDQWRNFNRYNVGDTIWYNGRQYKARNWTRGQEPGVLGNPWQEVTDQWRNFNVYNKGDVAWHDNKQFIARNYTSNEEPGDLNNDKWQEVTDQWRSYNTYNQGDIVMHNNRQYRAKWYNRNVEPGGQDNGPWELIH